MCQLSFSTVKSPWSPILQGNDHDFADPRQNCQSTLFVDLEPHCSSAERWLHNMVAKGEKAIPHGLALCYVVPILINHAVIFGVSTPQICDTDEVQEARATGVRWMAEVALRSSAQSEVALPRRCISDHIHG